MLWVLLRGPFGGAGETPKSAGSFHSPAVKQVCPPTGAMLHKKLGNTIDVDPFSAHAKPQSYCEVVVAKKGNDIEVSPIR